MGVQLDSDTQSDPDSVHPGVQSDSDSVQLGSQLDPDPAVSTAVVQLDELEMQSDSDSAINPSSDHIGRPRTSSSDSQKRFSGFGR